MTKFINFGCWNKYGCSETSAFKKIKDEASKVNDIDFIIVTGDNYYQDKINGNKIVNIKDILNGLNCLNQITDNDIYLLLGNHDLEITEGRCETLYLEKAFADGVNSQAKRNKFKLPDNLTMFKEINDNLIIMINSNIYADENLSCLHVIQDDFFINRSIEEQLEQESIKQYKIIEDYLSSKKFKNIIICAHHPLIGFKNQIIKTENINGKIKKNIKGGLDIYNVALYKLFLGLLSFHSDFFYYLCADIHNFQEGIVTIQNSEKTINIKQYIVGIGGTDLDDDYNEKYNLNYGVDTVINETDTSVLTANIIVKDDISLTYNIQNHFSNYGFIVVNIDNMSNINIEVVIISNKGGKTIKKKCRFKTKKNRKNKL
jgi:hypothetical protein